MTSASAPVKDSIMSAMMHANKRRPSGNCSATTVAFACRSTQQHTNSIKWQSAFCHELFVVIPHALSTLFCGSQSCSWKAAGGREVRHHSTNRADDGIECAGGGGREGGLPHLCNGGSELFIVKNGLWNLVDYSWRSFARLGAACLCHKCLTCDCRSWWWRWSSGG